MPFTQLLELVDERLIEVLDDVHMCLASMLAETTTYWLGLTCFHKADVRSDDVDDSKEILPLRDIDADAKIALFAFDHVQQCPCGRIFAPRSSLRV